MDQQEQFTSQLRSGLRVSLLSCAWSLATGSGAMAVGVLRQSLALVAFGAIGLVDAAGSAALVARFSHALSSQVVNRRPEIVAHRLIALGMGTIGIATIGDSAYRLAVRQAATSDLPGVIIASASIVVLPILARRKWHVARCIPSPALEADGWLSATGAVLATSALAGAVLQASFGWWWVDPLAAIGIGAGAVGLSFALRPTP